MKIKIFVAHHELQLVYRGAIGIGFLADIVSVSIAIQVSGLLALGSGIFVFLTMRETKKIE